MKLKQEDIKKYGKEEEIDFLLERNFDGTGPSGKGPRTGRGLGKCSKKRKKKRVREDIERFIGKERSLFFDKIIDEINDRCMSFGEGLGDDDIVKSILFKVWSNGYDKGYEDGQEDFKQK